VHPRNAELKVLVDEEKAVGERVEELSARVRATEGELISYLKGRGLAGERKGATGKQARLEGTLRSVRAWIMVLVLPVPGGW
jgi:hypothetical protein